MESVSFEVKSNLEETYCPKYYVTCRGKVIDITVQMSKFIPSKRLPKTLFGAIIGNEKHKN
jgi:hypothetical protein